MLLMPNFVFGSTGRINVPLNFLASLALHMDGVVVLFQYLFGHRYSLDSCRYCSHAWHPIDSRDSFHRPTSARVGQWWRRSFIDDRSYITATVDPEARSRTNPSTRTETFSTAGMEAEDEISVRPPRERRSQARPSMRQVELPDPVLGRVSKLPQLSIRVRDELESASSEQRSQSPAVFKNLSRKSKQTARSTERTVDSDREPLPLVPNVFRSSFSFEQNGPQRASPSLSVPPKAQITETRTYPIALRSGLVLISASSSDEGDAQNIEEKWPLPLPEVAPLRINRSAYPTAKDDVSSRYPVPSSSKDGNKSGSRPVRHITQPSFGTVATVDTSRFSDTSDDTEWSRVTAANGSGERRPILSQASSTLSKKVPHKRGMI
jgi:hypothetical protein